MGEKSDPILGYDLWGEPVYKLARRRGRPPFEWTEENSHKVSMLLAMGWSNDRIAGCILDPRTGKSISTPTLKRYFRSELQVREMARDMLFAKQMEAVTAQAFDGNVGAMRLLQQLIDKNDAAMASGRLTGDRSKSDEAKTERVGKKDAARAEARELVDGDAQTTWGDDLTPGYRN